MPVTVTRQLSSYSSRSISSASALSLRDGMTGSGRGRVPAAPSVYGGAGGFGTRISQSVRSPVPHGDTAVITNEKLTMQNLNHRLSSYLQKVRTLEEANRKLELQITQYHESKASPAASDFTHYFNTINELRAQIARKHAENQGVILQIDNAQLAAGDFKMKCDIEVTMRMTVEADVTRLRAVRGGLTVAISDLGLQIEGLKEELVELKVNHTEDMQALKVEQTGAVNVEVDSAASVDLTLVLQEVRDQYETLVNKKKMELEKWFQSKVETLQTQIVTHKTEATTSHTELSQVKKTYQGLEIQLQSQLAEIQWLEQNLEEANGRRAARLQRLQGTVDALELELQQLKASIEQQRTDYDLLLDIKMRLELEIAEYRRLLEGEYEERRAVIITEVVEEVKEHKPHVERRVKIITENIVDGVVVSSTSDTKVEEIQ
ncbi:keratin, type I cytoskeletal 19-like [Betta splendens]|uniref:Keratin, type I cytoskeletal 19-like n=1 Tax=Betta splendens TaxID=158456 RepID=A0A6P7M433_BETSP|nr:keratin, type I cytoskeletal 19-like [Betta splendens]